MNELSVVIGTTNTAPALRECLVALGNQDVQSASDFEVVVVVAGAATGLPGALRDLAVPYQLRVELRSEPERGGALNAGVATATGRFCLLLGDDVIADRGLVGAHLRAQHERTGIVGLGACRIALTHRPNGFARHRAQHHNAGIRRGEPPVDEWAGGTLSMSRTAFLAMGGFATDLMVGMETELVYRLVGQGYTAVHLPDATGCRIERRNAAALAAAAAEAGASAVALYRRHPPLLARLALGAFGATSLRALLLRRLCLALNVPIAPLLVLGTLLGTGVAVDEWYRFVADYCYWRGVRRAVPDRDTWRRLIRSPVILMYHAVGGDGEGAGCYIVPAGRFARQMAWLHRLGYSVIDLEEFLRDRRDHRLPPARSVILTFDDGYADNRTIALPILRRHGFTATIFLVSGAVGTANGWDSVGELAGRPLLSWEDVASLRQGGFTFGAHTRSHVALTAVPLDAREEEIAGSRMELERRLGRPGEVFAYPYGRFDSVSQALVERAGFLGACCSRSGMNDPQIPDYALRRIEVRGDDSLARFALALLLGTARSLSRLWRGG